MRLGFLGLVLASIGTRSLWEAYQINISTILVAILTVVLVRVILPRLVPSSYSRTPIGFIYRFVFVGSFSLTFFMKLILSLSLKYLYDINGRFLISDHDNFSTPLIFSANLVSVVWLAGINIYFKNARGGYLLYIPVPADIQRLGFMLSHPAQGKDPVILNYHMLRFIQENFHSSSPTLHGSTEISNSIEMSPVNSLPEPSVESEPSSLSLNEKPPPEGKAEGSSPCKHPSSLVVLRPLTRSPNEGKTIPLAELCCQGCASHSKIGEIHTEFTEMDRKYTEDKFDVTYEARAADAVVRGGAVARQFVFGLPKGLSLSPDARGFSF